MFLYFIFIERNNWKNLFKKIWIKFAGGKGSREVGSMGGQEGTTFEGVKEVFEDHQYSKAVGLFSYWIWFLFAILLMLHDWLSLKCNAIPYNNI